MCYPRHMTEAVPGFLFHLSFLDNVTVSLMPVSALLQQRLLPRHLPAVKTATEPVLHDRWYPAFFRLSRAVPLPALFLFRVFQDWFRRREALR